MRYKILSGTLAALLFTDIVFHQVWSRPANTSTTTTPPIDDAVMRYADIDALQVLQQKREEYLDNRTLELDRREAVLERREKELGEYLYRKEQEAKRK